MKRWLKATISTVALMLVLAAVYGLIFTIKAEAFAADVDLNNLSFAVDGDCGETALIQAQKEYNMLPENITERFYKDGWQLVLTARGNLLNEKYGEGYGGMADAGEKILYVKCDTGMYVTAKYSALAHEVGHYVDYTLDNISESQAFTAIMEAEKEAYTACSVDNAYGLTNQNEYFACMFSLYINEPELCEQHMPLAFDFMQNCVAAI